jgi:hypothetical protein
MVAESPDHGGEATGTDRQGDGMAQAAKIIKALQVLEKYGPVNVEAEHDVIYAGPEGEPEYSDVDKLALDELGWHFEADVGNWAKFT